MAIAGSADRVHKLAVSIPDKDLVDIAAPQLVRFHRHELSPLLLGEFHKQSV